MNVDESSMEYQAEMVCSVDGGSFVFTQQKYYSQGYSMCQYLGNNACTITVADNFS